MTDKQKPPVAPLKPGDFQLPDHWKTGSGMIVDGLVNNLCDFINALDLNHDGRRDVAELAPYVGKIAPIAVELFQLVDTDKLKAFLKTSDIFKDAATAATKIELLAQHIDAIALLAPKP